jgi:hypothetical protein
MNKITHTYSKKDIYSILKENKTLQNNKTLTFDMIRNKMRIKPNHPNYYHIHFELLNNYKIIFQANNDDEFPEFTATLMKEKTPICRIDYHDSHRRKCKKVNFNCIQYNDLHIHLYCNECINEKFKWDSFVLDLKKNFSNFEDFCELCCKITNINYDFSQKGLF